MSISVSERRSLTGWGRTSPSAARVAAPATVEQVAELVAGPPAGARGLLARGLGRSYGDAAQTAGGLAVSTAALTGIRLDTVTGIAEVGAGCSLDALLLHSVPRGWFVPVTPGTRFVTVGGAVAADVHGKNHHVDGTLGAHVLDLDLVDGRGEVHRLTPADDAFWATVGGLGLTGVVTRVRLRMRRVESAWIAVRTERAATLDTLLTLLREHDGRYRYTVAWIDVLARGAAFGRGVITSGEHAAADAVRARGVAEPLAYAPRVRLAAPQLPVGAVTRATARIFDAAWYAKGRTRDSVDRLEAFFHPLDGVRNWNRLYGPHGFLQYQFVVPDGREDVVERALQAIAAAGPAFLGVLKRFGAADPGPLSFPRPGWTLAVDVPTPARSGEAAGLAARLDRLDEAVADAGGAVYLVKDARCRPELLETMYPGLARWRAVRDRLDPERRFVSDLSRRMGL